MPHSVQFTDITCQFYLSEDLLEKRFYDGWQNLIYDDVWQNLQYYDQFVGTVVLTKTAKSENKAGMGTYILHEAWPMVVGEVDQSYSSSDQVSTLPITFAFRHWEMEN